MPAIEPSASETTDESWDGQQAESNIDNDANYSTMRQAYAWESPDVDTDDPSKSDFSFIHHEVDGDGNIGAANVTACQTGIATLNGARLDSPPSEQDWGDDRQGIWDHLAQHLRDADVEPPELRSLDEADKEWRDKNDMPEETKGDETDEEKNDFPNVDVDDNPNQIPSGAREERTFSLLEVRADEDDETVEGMAAVFDQPTEIKTPFGEHKEVIREGFFEPVMDDDVRMLWNHNPEKPMARTKNGTLKIEQRSEGLFTKADANDTQYSRDAVKAINRGDVDQMSFGFNVAEDNWTEANDGTPKRELLEAESLLDVSPVTYPAYSETNVNVRSQIKQISKRTNMEFEHLFDAIFRAESGQVEQQDEAIIRQAIDNLNDLLPESRNNLDYLRHKHQKQKAQLY